MQNLTAPLQPDPHLPHLLKGKNIPLLRQNRQMLRRQLDKVEQFQLQQVCGNLCPLLLHLLLKLKLF